MKSAGKPGSVWGFNTLTVIPLVHELLRGSSHLPANSTSRVIACLFGVAPSGGCRVSPLIKTASGLVSVALFLAFPKQNMTTWFIADGRYPPPCSMEPGLSSMQGTCLLGRRFHPHTATVWPTSFLMLARVGLR